MSNAIIPPTGSFLTLTVRETATATTDPATPPLLAFYRKMDGKPPTLQDVERVATVRCIDRPIEGVEPGRLIYNLTPEYILRRG
jgi:hypothetical protein